MSSDTANLTEVFSSIQGEGVHIGRRQIFIRFIGCNLTCEYCDTNQIQSIDHCRLESTPGRNDFTVVSNPVPMDRVAELVGRWNDGWPSVHHSISLTGGEPLLQVKIIQQWLGRLRSVLPVHLETNGVLHSALSSVVNELDHVSMDIKLPSSSGEQSLWEHHRAFLAVAAATDVAVKVVVSSATEHWEIVRAAEMIASVSASIPLVIQPETGADLSIKIAATPLIELQELAAGILDDVRIIPQTHRFIGLL